MRRGTAAYYRSMGRAFRKMFGIDGICDADVQGVDDAAALLESVEAGDMTKAEAVEYANDPGMDALPGIAWVRKAAREVRA